MTMASGVKPSSSAARTKKQRIVKVAATNKDVWIQVAELGHDGRHVGTSMG